MIKRFKQDRLARKLLKMDSALEVAWFRLDGSNTKANRDNVELRAEQLLDAARVVNVFITESGG